MKLAVLSYKSKTVIDLSDDVEQITYLTSNHPATQVYDPNPNGGYKPDWSSDALIITPILYVNGTQIGLNTEGLTVTWTRKAGSLAETSLLANDGESVSGNVLTVNRNKLEDVESANLSYLIDVQYAPVGGMTRRAKASIQYTMMKTGTSAKYAWISGEQAFRGNANGADYAPSSIALYAHVTNVTVSKWQYRGSAGTWIDYPISADNPILGVEKLTVKPDHAVFFGNTATIRQITSNESVFDTYSIYKVFDGAVGRDSYSVVLSNEAHVFKAGSIYAVEASTFTDVSVYKGNAKIKASVIEVTGMPTGMTATITNNATDHPKITINVAPEMSQANGELQIQISADGQSWAKTFSYCLAITGQTGLQGVHGTNSAIVTIYRRAVSTPLVPTANMKYTFATGVLDGPIGMWSQSIPDGEYPCYVTTAAAISNADTVQISRGDWATVVKLAENGYNSAQMYLYKREDTAPNLPTSNLEYDFATDTLTGDTFGWTRTIPATNGKPCYTTCASLVTKSTVDTISSTEWSNAIKIVEDGTDGANAKSIDLSATSQVIGVDKNGSSTPESIVITALTQNTNITTWQYSMNGGKFTYTLPSGVTRNGYTITIASNLVTAKTISILASDGDIVDVITVVRTIDGSDGDTGASSSIAFLTNENVTFTANSSGQIPMVSKSCSIVAYTGTEKVTPSIGTITDIPSGMTITPQSGSSNEIPLLIQISNNSTQGGQQGTVYIPVTSPVSTTLLLHWSKANAGAGGENAVSFKIYTPQGNVFMNGAGTLMMQTVAYDGATAITSGATYVWKKYVSGSWITLSDKSSSLGVNGSSVQGLITHQCIMAYGGKTYTDTCTQIDKTDSYQATITSTNGDILRSGSSYQICRLWQGAIETDSLLCNGFGFALPVSPSKGDFFYKAVRNVHAVQLMRYDGNSWNDVTNSAVYKHTKTYNWYRRDDNGDPLDGGLIFATGKIICINATDIELKTTFICEVE